MYLILVTEQGEELPQMSTIIRDVANLLDSQGYDVDVSHAYNPVGMLPGVPAVRIQTRKMCKR